MSKPYTSVYIDDGLVAVTRDEFDQRILQALEHHVLYGATTTDVARAATGGYYSSSRRYGTPETQSNYGRVRRRLQALFDAGKVRRRKGYSRGWAWSTNDADLRAAHARKTADKATRAAEVKRIAMSLGFLLDEGPLPGDDPEDDPGASGKNPYAREQANDRKLSHGFAIELTNEEFLALARKAGLTTMETS